MEKVRKYVLRHYFVNDTPSGRKGCWVLYRAACEGEKEVHATFPDLATRENDGQEELWTAIRSFLRDVRGERILFVLAERIFTEPIAQKAKSTSDESPYDSGAIGRILKGSRGPRHRG